MNNLKIIFFLTLISCISGCRGLQVNDEDSTALATTKVTGRVFLDIFTLGIAELEFYEFRKMDSWLGIHKSNLIQSWGPPDSVFKDDNGNEIYTYMSSATLPGNSTALTNYSPQGGIAPTNAIYTAPEEIPVKRMFFINSSGIIYKWIK